ncbi:MAG TPA: SH3 domain-containing protein [Allosphingosinicella sp.]|jgi:uncharacterized protein YcfJ
MPPPQGQVRRRRGSRGLCAGIGIVVGAIFGGIFGSGRRRDGFNEQAAIAGGVGTSLICRSVRWRSVHRRDQEEVNRRIAAMTVDPAAANQAYRSETTGKSYNIVVGERTYQSVDAEFTTIEQVAPPQMGANISATPYRVTAAVLNLRSSPGTETGDRVTGAFYQGDVIESMSETPDGQWVLVGYQNVGFGWVARRFLAPISGPRDQLVFAVPGEPPPPQVAPARTASRQRRGGTATPSRPTNLVSSPPRRIAAAPATRTQTVRAQMVCRGFTVTNDRQRSDSHRSCAGPRGQIQIG